MLNIKRTIKSKVGIGKGIFSPSAEGTSPIFWLRSPVPRALSIMFIITGCSTMIRARIQLFYRPGSKTGFKSITLVSLISISGKASGDG